MQAAIAPRGDERTFLTHFVGSGLDNDRYVVEKFLSLANGDIVPAHADGAKPKGRRKARGTILPLKAVEKVRPARDEIIIATRVKLRECGVQLWGWRSLGIFADRRQRSWDHCSWAYCMRPWTWLAARSTGRPHRTMTRMAGTCRWRPGTYR